MFADYTGRRAEFDPGIARYDRALEPSLPLPNGPDAPFDLRPRLSRIRAPTLILVGRHDFNCGPTSAEEMRRGIAESRVVTFERSGHMPQVEETEAFVAAVRDFLAAHP
jgi:proline iminopeptidase